MKRESERERERERETGREGWREGGREWLIEGVSVDGGLGRDREKF